MIRRVFFLFGLLLLLQGCQELPKVPRHVQYGVYPLVKPPGFYGVDNETKQRHYRPWDHPEMRGAQCLTISDYKKMTNWVQSIKEIARERCK